MGSWFTNYQIRKTDTVTRDSVCGGIKDYLAGRKYTLVENETDADVAVAVIATQNSEWITVCSPALAHDDPASCKSVAAPLSAQFHTDVMGIACFDSDYLYLNLINTDEEVDGWIGIGSGKEVGITRRNKVTPWKKKVTDYITFANAVKGMYACADLFLAEVEASLRLPVEQGMASLEGLEDTSIQQEAVLLYFRQEEGASAKGPDLRIVYMRFAVPCFDGRKNEVFLLNLGDEFTGMSVYFLGPYVEHEEITFSQITLGRMRQPWMELSPMKIQLSDGQWAYHCHVPDILIPPGIPQRMAKTKRYEMERERIRVLSFVPHGNPRKMLDITVVVIPDGQPETQAVWNIWRPHGSKEKLIKKHNSIWKMVRAMGEDPAECLPLLKLEDFDE